MGKSERREGKVGGSNFETIGTNEPYRSTVASSSQKDHYNLKEYMYYSSIYSFSSLPFSHTHIYICFCIYLSLLFFAAYISRINHRSLSTARIQRADVLGRLDVFEMRLTGFFFLCVCVSLFLSFSLWTVWRHSMKSQHQRVSTQSLWGEYWRIASNLNRWKHAIVLQRLRQPIQKWGPYRHDLHRQRLNIVIGITLNSFQCQL